MASACEHENAPAGTAIKAGATMRDGIAHALRIWAITGR
jgi:hypothetical protein